MEFELDEMLVVDFMSQAYDPTNTNDAIVADCSEGLEDISMVKIWHCYWEVNKCVDALAKCNVNLY